MKALIFDTETTGLPRHPDSKIGVQPKIIEFGGLLVDENGFEFEELNILINPGEPLDPIITKITGLTDDDLVDEPGIAEVMPAIRALFEQADLLVAHNLPFDSGLIALECSRLGIDDWPWPQLGLCTAQENSLQWGKRPKLTELFEAVTGEPLAQTHRAIDDCRALAEIVTKEGYIEKYKRATAQAKKRIQLPDLLWTPG